MKKLITIFAAIAMLAVSCQQEDIINNDEGTGITTGNTGKLTARFAGTTTRVGYTVMDEDEDWNWNYDYDYDDYYYGLLPAWEVGDEIIGFDDDGNTYTLTVASIDAETATLSGTVPDGNLHLIYKYGAQASDISNKTLAVDYSDQVGDDETMPAVMLADGTVVGGSCDFEFRNAGAIISIYDTSGLPAGSKVTNITFSGENLSAATIALDGGALALTATENTDDAISVYGLDLTVIEEKNYSSPTSWSVHQNLSRPFWIAVPDGAEITKVSINYLYEKPTPVTVPAKEGDDYVTIGGKKWAKWNIGATYETDFGWYFYWGGTEKCWRHKDPDNDYEDAWWKLPAESYEYSFDIGDEYAYASTYYKCSPSFESEYADQSCEFTWKYTPFNNGSTSPNTEYFKTIWNDVCPLDGDGNRNLASDYDAAHVIWGGTWRMPTWNDFMDLIIACGGEEVSYDGFMNSPTFTPTPLPSANPGKGIYWVSAEQTYISDYTGVAGVLFCDGSSKLFFPAGGFGSLDIHELSENRYYSSTLNIGGPGNAIVLRFNDTKVHTDQQIRAYGCPIRPVSD